MKHFFAILGVFVLLSAFTYNNSPAVDGNTLPSVNIKSLDGKTVNIQDFVGKGKVTVISFWATWCSPCKRELDAIADIYPDWQDEYDVELLAITIDDARGVAKVPAMVAAKGWDYTVLSDSKQELQRALNFQTVPQTFLLNAKGEVVYTHSGYSPGDEFELEEEIKKAAGK
jgi:peroxiredoxin